MSSRFDCQAPELLCVEPLRGLLSTIDRKGPLDPIFIMFAIEDVWTTMNL